MSGTIDQIYNQSANTNTTTLTAADGKSYLYQSQIELVNGLSSGTSEGHDIFSPSFYYNAVTTWTLAEAKPDAFKISAEDAQGLGEQLQSNAAAMLFESMAAPSGVDVLGSLYASNGVVSFLGEKSTYTFQAVA